MRTRGVIVGVLAAVLTAAGAAGCGGGGADASGSADNSVDNSVNGLQRVAGDAQHSKPPPPPSHAPVLVHMSRVQGDDPLPFILDLHADATAAVQYGGGRSGFETKRVRLSPAQQARLRHALRVAPWKEMASRTVTPGGFSRSDNGIVYAVLYRGHHATLEGRMPAKMKRVVRMLSAIIDGDLGKTIYAARISPMETTPPAPR